MGGGRKICMKSGLWWCNILFHLKTEFRSLKAADHAAEKEKTIPPGMPKAFQGLKLSAPCWEKCFVLLCWLQQCPYADLYPGHVLLLQLGQEHALEPCAHTHTHTHTHTHLGALCCTPRCCKPKSAKRNREWGRLRRINPTRLSGWWIYWGNGVC